MKVGHASGTRSGAVSFSIDPEEICGVYAFLCVMTFQIYVGSSFVIQERLVGHLVGLKNGGGKHNRAFKECFYRYGPNGFVPVCLEVIREKISGKELKEREQLWINSVPSCLSLNSASASAAKTGVRGYPWDVLLKALSEGPRFEVGIASNGLPKIVRTIYQKDAI